MSRAALAHSGIENLADLSRSADIVGVLMAGGEQRRMERLQLPVPKSLIKPQAKMVGRLAVEQLLRVAPNVLLMAGRNGELLSKALLDKRVSVRTDPVIGTGTAAWFAAESSKQPILLFANADTLNDPCVATQVIDTAALHDGDAVIGLTRRAQFVQNPGAFAVDAQGSVIRSFEDRKGGRPPVIGASWHGSSTGVVLIPRRLLLETVKGQWRTMTSLERDILPALIACRRLFAADCGDVFSLDIGTPERVSLLDEVGDDLRRIDKA